MKFSFLSYTTKLTCGTWRLRCYNTGEELQKLGHHVSYNLTDKADVVIAHRIYNPKVFNNARFRIFDIDDNFFFPRKEDKVPSRRKAVLNMAKEADLVTVSSPYLAEYFKQEGLPVEVIPTAFDLPFCVRKTNYRRTNTIGWIGVSTNQKYIQPYLPLFTSLKLKLVIISDKLKLNSKIIEFIPWSLRSYEFLTKCDFGIAPLFQSPWELAKSGVKPLTYWAIGLPVIASPIPAYIELSKQSEIEFIAVTTKQWENFLKMDDIERQRQAEAGHSFAWSNYSPTCGAKKLLETIKQRFRDDKFYSFEVKKEPICIDITQSKFNEQSLKFVFHTWHKNITEKASCRLRCYNIGKELEKMGHKVYFNRNVESDVVILQQVYDEALLEKGKFKIFDINDNYFKKGKSDDIEKITKKVDLVTVSTNYLAQYIRKLNVPVAVIPTSFDLPHPIVKEHHTQTKKLGWIGGYENQKYLVPYLPLFEKLGFKLLIISDKLVIDHPIIQFTPWSLHAYDQLIDCDFGIAPLSDSPWELAKSAVKPLTYFAMKLPVIASPNPEYREVEKRSGAEFIAKTKYEWKFYLGMSKERRKRQAELGYRYAWEARSPEKIATQFLKVVKEKIHSNNIQQRLFGVNSSTVNQKPLYEVNLNFKERIKRKTSVAILARSSNIVSGGTRRRIEIANRLADLGWNVTLYTFDEAELNPRWHPLEIRVPQGKRIDGIKADFVICGDVFEDPSESTQGTFNTAKANVCKIWLLQLITGKQRQVLSDSTIVKAAVSTHMINYLKDKFDQEAWDTIGGVDTAFFHYKDEPSTFSTSYFKTKSFNKNLRLPVKVNQIDGSSDQFELRERYWNSNLYISLEVGECWGWCNPVAEAMACGRTAIALDCGSVQDLIVNGHTGIIVNDIKELSQAISELKNDVETRMKLAENALRHVQQFSWDNVALKFDRLLMNL